MIKPARKKVTKKIATKPPMPQPAAQPVPAPSAGGPALTPRTEMEQLKAKVANLEAQLTGWIFACDAMVADEDGAGGDVDGDGANDGARVPRRGALCLADGDMSRAGPFLLRFFSFASVPRPQKTTCRRRGWWRAGGSWCWSGGARRRSGRGRRSPCSNAGQDRCPTLQPSEVSGRIFVRGYARIERGVLLFT